MLMARALVFGLIPFVALPLSGCGNETVRPSRQGAVDNAADQKAGDQTAGETPSDALDGLTFQDVGDTSTCTQDCSGHDAGFEWARDRGISYESECGGNSQSFIEGCQEYARQVQEREESEEGKEEEF